MCPAEGLARGENSINSLSGDCGSWQGFGCFHVPGSDDGISSKVIRGWGSQG